MSAPGHPKETIPASTAAPTLPKVFCEGCPTRMILERVADKWVVLILTRLAEGTMRFNQLRREVEGVAQKVLSQTLKKLERDGLVSRKAFATVPVTVEYSITPLGLTLAKAIAELAHWAQDNIGEVLAAQALYDSARDDDA